MTVMTTDQPTANLLDELRVWLADNWDPDLSVGEWWQRLGLAGWATPILPVGSYGRGVSRGESLQVAKTIADHGALSGPIGLGPGLAAPTLTTHGTEAQIERFVPDIVTGQLGWCQLFSEPGAGSGALRDVVAVVAFCVPCL